MARLFQLRRKVLKASSLWLTLLPLNRQRSESPAPENGFPCLLGDPATLLPAFGRGVICEPLALKLRLLSKLSFWCTASPCDYEHVLTKDRVRTAACNTVPA